MQQEEEKIILFTFLIGTDLSVVQPRAVLGVFSERAKLPLGWCQLRFWILNVHIICRYVYVKIIARAFVMVPIHTHVNNCSVGTRVFGKLSILTLTFLVALIYYVAKRLEESYSEENQRARSKQKRQT